MDSRQLWTIGLLALLVSVQGITEKQKLERKKRNVITFPKLPNTLDQIQHETQSEMQFGSTHESQSHSQFQWQSQSQSQSQSQMQWQSQSQSNHAAAVTCEPRCVHGECVDMNKCSCEEGWSGLTCEEFECENICVHGKCISPNTCECNSGWGGDSCDEASCASECMNGGVCSAPDTCKCKAGWSGATCETPLCEKECLNGGACVAPNTCVCANGFEGTLCQIQLPSECRFPFEYNGNIYSTCTTVDSTDDNAWCSRTTAYQGERVTCDFKSLCTAPGQFIEIPGNCGYYYLCTEENSIVIKACPAGTVYNVISGGCDTPDNTPHCQFNCKHECENGGHCVAQDTCDCASGFTGKNCEIEVDIESSGEIAMTPKGHVCSLWGKKNFYTFDGLLYSSSGRCSYQLMSDCGSNQFTSTLSFNQTTQSSILTIVFGGEDTLILTQGIAIYNSKQIPIPSVFGEFHLSHIPNTEYILLSGQSNDWVAWDGMDNFFISMDLKTWTGRLCGLCGNMDGNLEDDMTPKGETQPTSDVAKFMNSWSLDNECTSGTHADYCALLTDEQLQDVATTCSRVVAEVQFESCDVPNAVLEETCVQSLCQCSSGDYKSCICNAVTQYSKLCIASGANVSEWRTHEFCERKCPSNLVYTECGTACAPTCRNKHQNMMCTRQCIDGCFCPPGTYLDGDKCVTEEECSCTHQGEIFTSGHWRKEACQECQCNGGIWSCNELPCFGECAATGDPHYRTFDGLSYTFTGDCQYVLSTDGCNNSTNFTFAVIAENVKCGTDEAGTCTKSAAIVLKNKLVETKYKLKQGGIVSVAGSDVLLPYSHGDVRITYLSSMMILMKTSSGLEIEWDGAMRLYVKLDPAWKNKVCGMCGNFNSKSIDDMRTPHNAIETNVGSFGNSWKVNQECPDVDCHRQPVLPESCLASQHKQAYAEEVCGVVKSGIFASCHSLVDWGTYYYNCRNDVCDCGEGKECMCEALADYARACAAQGLLIDWRNQTTCPVTCAEGMEYKECAGYCGATCRSIGDVLEVCDTVCQPGCVCKEGLYLTEQNACVEIQECGCFHDGEMYYPGDVLEEGSMSCTCTSGLMSCETSQHTEACKSPLTYLDCSTLPKGSTGLACEPTCQNSQKFCSSEHCVSGCTCPEGTIRDEAFGTCVKPDLCSCSYGGESYKGGKIISPDTCNTCTCTRGSWTCTEKACPAECSSVGDPHFTTFDGSKYNFQGDCAYTMAEDYCGNETSGSFRVIIETIPCGNNDVTCTKAVNFYLYNYVIRLTKGDGEPIVSEDVVEGFGFQQAPSNVQYNIRKGSIYYIVETNIGIDLLWNAENAAKIQLQPNYMGTVCGLCGNYDGDMSNDLQMRGGDVAADPNMFGNEWKVVDTCPDAIREPHPCQDQSDRAPWAEKKCNILNSEIFESCHAKVDPAQYYDNCLYDTCGCDFGGDCACFCTSVAVYAQACAQAGICINWRNNEVCPIMCEAYNPGFGKGENETCEWKYEACGNPCPRTCDDRNPTCPWTQLEGCYVTCKDDEVWDDTSKKCVLESTCPPITTTTPAPTTTTAKPHDVVTTVPTTPKTPPPTTTTPTACQCVDSNGAAHWPGETWPLRGDEELCVDLTCVEESAGVCKTESTDKRLMCTAENKPVCKNGYAPVAIEDGCTCQWECQCYCFGQGDPHFFTFDGFYYPFQGNCTFVLSRDMNGHHTNHPHEYEVWMENEACENAPQTTCTRKMTLRYGSTHLVLFKNYTYTINGGSLQLSNSLPTDINGIHIEIKGISLFYVTIAEIDLTLTFTGEDYSWSLKVPYSKYFDKTEGLCGVCNNDQSDDFTNRTGVVVTDIEDFGNSWLVYKESKKCFRHEPPCSQPPAKECDIILSDVFMNCHAVIDPEVFYKICQYDTSQCGNYTYCEALYGYARACDHEGVCINWRSEDVCPIECPSNRIYRSCMPNCEQQCSNVVSGTQCEDEEAVEGCFCPPDTALVNGDCVDKSNCTNCVDNDGTIYQYGESWVPADESCSICSCMEDQDILCTTKKCPSGSNEVPSCSPCYISEMERGSDPCCPTYKCVCNYNLGYGTGDCGPVVIPECNHGYVPIRTNPEKCIPEYECQCNTTRNPCPAAPTCGELEHVVTAEGECCPEKSCECKPCVEDTTVCTECEDRWLTVDYCGCKHYSCEIKGVCRFNGTDRLPGDSWPTSPCETCTCDMSDIGNDGCYAIQCATMSCSTFCPPCSEYTEVPGQCCGTCVQTGCQQTNMNGDLECKVIGDNWFDYLECNQYSCLVDGSGYVGVVTNPITCPVMDLPTCASCYRLSAYLDNCCAAYECVPDDICCMDDMTIKVPDEMWYPDSCTSCHCTGAINQTTGFHKVSCDHNPCPSFDEETCSQNGGQAVPTNDGCCLKCDNKCVDNNNNTYMFGETWYPDSCTVCSCAAGHEIVCNSVTCPKGHKATIPDCNSCEVARRRASSDPCCPQYDCVCNYDFAQGEENCNAVTIPKCPPGYVTVQTNQGDCIPEYDCVCNMSRNPCPEAPVCNSVLEHLVTTDTECCPMYNCECKACAQDTTACSPCEQSIVTFDACGCRHVTCESKNVCLSQGVTHNVGDTWNPDVCTECSCHEDVDSTTSCHIQQCVSTYCDTNCPDCYEYVGVPGQCCGQCIQTGCPLTHQNGNTECKSAGDMWSYVSNCTEYMCKEDTQNGGLHIVEGDNFQCPALIIPPCPACHKLETYTKDCCPQFRCVKDDVCCDDGTGKMPGTSWSPSTCETCYCSDVKNSTTGFYNEKCYHAPCPPIDTDACEANGGVLTSTDDGCCLKCQASECYECSRRISTKLEYMVIDQCASTQPVSMSYCDGFCRGSFFWSAEGSESQCSCCNPTSTTMHVVSMKCKNGTEIEYNYEDILSCGCSSTCTPKPPTVTPKPEAPVTTTTKPVKPTPGTTTEQPEESGSGEIIVTIPEAPVTTTTKPVKPTPGTTEQPEESGSGEIVVTIPEAPVTTTTKPVKPTPGTTTEQPEESGSGEIIVTIPEAPVTTTTKPVKPTPGTTTEQPEESGSGEIIVTIPEAPVTTTTKPVKPTPGTTTEQPEESGSGEIIVTIPEAPVTTTTKPVKPTPETTTEQPEESGSGEIIVTIPEAPVTTTTKPVKPTPGTTTEQPEESGSGEIIVTIPEAPVTTTTKPVKPTPGTTTEQPEESGSGEIIVTIPEAPVTTTTKPVKPTPGTTTTEQPEESGSGEIIVTIPEAPVTTTKPVKPTPWTTTEQPEESGSGEIVVTIPEAPVITTTKPVKPTPGTTTEQPEESGSGEIVVTIPEAPVTTTTKPVKPTPGTTTEQPEESGSGEIVVTIPEAPVTTTTKPVKPTPGTTTEQPEESGSGEIVVTIPEAPVTTTTKPVKPTPGTTTEQPEESGSGEIVVTIPEAPVTTTTKPVKPTPGTTTTTEQPEESGSGEVIVTIPEAPVTTTSKAIPTTIASQCYWSDWINSDSPKLPQRDDNETFVHAISSGYDICKNPDSIECRPVGGSVEDFKLFQEWQKVSCNVATGLLCLGSQQTTHPVCEDYEIRVYCCSKADYTTTTAFIPEAPVTTTTKPIKPTPGTTTEQPEESGSGEVTVTIPEAPVTTTTKPIKPTPGTTTEQPEESGSGEIIVTIPEAPVTTTTKPVKPTPGTPTEQPEESGSGEITVTIPEAPVTTTTKPIKPTPGTTTEQPEESGSGEIIVTIPEAPVTTTTKPVKPTPGTTTEKPEESGSGEIILTIPPEAPVTTTTKPVKPTPGTTTEQPEESGSGEITVTIPEAPVTTTTKPIKPTPGTTTEQPEESGSGEIIVTIPEAPVTTTTKPVKPTPGTTTEQPEESGSGEIILTIPPEAPVITTTKPVKPTPVTTTEQPEESGSGDVIVTIPEAPVTSTTKPVPTTTIIASTASPCYWSDWINSDSPKLPYRDDNETFVHAISSGYDICKKPDSIECRPVGGSVDDFKPYQTWQTVSCNAATGLLCLGSQQEIHPVCEDYEIRVYCCPASQSQSQSQSQGSAQDGVNAVENEIQNIISKLENDEPSSEQAMSQHFGNAEIHKTFDNIHHQEQVIDTDLQSLMDQINSENWKQGSESSQVQAQQQMQSEIHSLDQQIHEQSQLQQQSQQNVASEVKHLIQNVESADSVDVSPPLGEHAHDMIQKLDENLAQNLQHSEDVNSGIQKSLHELLQDNQFSSNDQVKEEVDQTANDLQDLEQTQSNMMHQQQSQFQTLDNFVSNSEYQQLGDMVGQHLQQSQQAQAKRSKSLEEEIEELLS